MYTRVLHLLILCNVVRLSQQRQLAANANRCCVFVTVVMDTALLIHMQIEFQLLETHVQKRLGIS